MFSQNPSPCQGWADLLNAPLANPALTEFRTLSTHQLARHLVTAVIVAHDGARWLPETLDGLRGQTRPVQRVVAVDNGSRDRSGVLLSDAFGPGCVLHLSRGTGYGEAVAEALRHPAANTPQLGSLELNRGDLIEWVWLLHDDSAPDPRALEHLLAAADGDPHAAILGPKLRDSLDRRLLVEVGVTIDPAGRRETGLERREYDQGQHDGIREVLAVSTAGMLVRRDVWESLGGLDPELPLFRDDVDFGWRANTAGYRVLVVTDAVMYHAEASARRRRRIAAASDHPRRVDRRNALYVLFANLPTGALLWALVRNVVGSLLRTVLFLLAKQPANALDEIAAISSVFSNPRRMFAARRRRAKDRRRGYASIKRLLPPPGHSLRRLADMVQSFLSGAGPVESIGRHHAVVLPPGEDDEEALLTDSGVVQRIFTHPGVLLGLMLLAVTLVAERSLLGGRRIGGGALVPMWGGASDLWAAYTAGYHAAGAGSDAGYPPYVGVVALLATVLGGKPWLAVTVLLLGCVPLAGMAAYFAARRVVPHVPAQLWLASSYALLPVATGAIAAGRLGTAVVFVLLPVLGVLATQVLTDSRKRARRAAWGFGLLLAVATAFVPLIWLLALVVCGFTWLAFGGSRRGLGTNLTIVAATPVVLLGPWLAWLFRHPSLFLLEAGLHRPELVDARLSAHSLLLLSPGGPGLPPTWVSGGILLAGLAALLLRRQRFAVACGWGLALFGLLVAILMSRIPITSSTGGPAVPAWPGVALAFAAVGVVLAAAVAAHRVAELRAAGGLPRLLATGVALVALSAPVLAGLSWAIAGVQGPLKRNNPEVLPAFVAAGPAYPGGQARTLVVRERQDGGLWYTILRGREPLLGEAEVPAPEPVRSRLSQLVAGLASGRGGDDGQRLARFGIQHVLAPAPVAPALRRALDSVPELARISLTSNFGLWRLTPPAAQLGIVDAAGTFTPLSNRPFPVTMKVPAGEGRRTLILAEPADGGWRATMDGEELKPRTVDGWAQGFELPPSAGVVKVTRGEFWRHFWVALQAILLLVVALLALPGQRSEEAEDEGEPPPSRTLQPARRTGGHRARPDAKVPAMTAEGLA